MIVIDENIIESQRQQLLQSRLRVRQIGFEVGRKGMDDRDQILPLLHQLNRVTFFTRDDDFYLRELCHPQYCLVILAAPKDRMANLIVQTIRYPDFNTQRKRLGRVLRVSSTGIRFWQSRNASEQVRRWTD